jgi:group I intron endonuclease
MIYMFIYCITNRVNGKKYIGQTVKPVSVRFAQHCRDSKLFTTRLYSAMRHYGIDNFEVEQICSCNSLEELNQMEKYYIAKYDTMNPDKGYNMTAGGEINPMDCIPARVKHDSIMRTPEVRNKISQGMKESYARRGGATPEHRQKLSAAIKRRYAEGWRPDTSNYTHEKHLQAGKKLRKPVYCLSAKDGKFYKQFDSLKSAILDVYGVNKDVDPEGYCSYAGKIKRSSDAKKAVDGLFWFYGVYEDKSCVETISKESRGEASSKRRGLLNVDKI